MQLSAARIDGPLLIEPTVHGDERGFFVETFRQETLAQAGAQSTFVQDNHSRSGRGIVRGMHFQPGQVKLIRCARGRILDVVVDIRRGSPTFGEWESFELSDENHWQLLCPDGFAHGFCVRSEVADVTYKVSSYYDPASERGFRFDDPAVGIDWGAPPAELIASARDRDAPLLEEIAAELPYNYQAR
jgi:dTDP-4-dehydrorhamnose 3,5-epimerase